MSNSGAMAGDVVGAEVVRGGANLLTEENQMKMKGQYDIEVVRNGVVVDRRSYPNVITLEGRRHILEVAMTGGTDTMQNASPTTYKHKSPFYVFLSATTFSAVPEQTYDVPQVTEYTGQTETDLPPWAGVLDPTLSMMTNTAAKATFTITTPATIKGAGLVSAITKGLLGQIFATAQNVLVSYSTFQAPIDVTLGDVVNVTIALSLT
jgi:hypothetical protein